MSTTPGSVTTPLAAGHAYEITVSKGDVASLSANGQDAASDAWDAIDGLLNGGVTVANQAGQPTPGSPNAGSDMADGGDVWVATVTPSQDTSIGGATALFPISYAVVDVSGNVPGSSGMLAKIMASVKAHPVVAAVAAGLALVFIARPMRQNPRVRRMRSALRF